MTDGFSFVVTILFLQDVSSGFEFHNLLSGDLDSFTRLGVTASSGGTLVHAHGTETNESDFAVFFQFSFSDIQDGIDSLSCIDLGHAGFCSNGIN